MISALALAWASAPPGQRLLSAMLAAHPAFHIGSQNLLQSSCSGSLAWSGINLAACHMLSSGWLKTRGGGGGGGLCCKQSSDD